LSKGASIANWRQPVKRFSILIRSSEMVSMAILFNVINVQAQPGHKLVMQLIDIDPETFYELSEVIEP